MRQTAAWRLPGAGAGEGLHQGFGEHSGDQGPGQERASIRDSGEHSGDQGLGQERASIRDSGEHSGDQGSWSLH